MLRSPKYKQSELSAAKSDCLSHYERSEVVANKKIFFNHNPNLLKNDLFTPPYNYFLFFFTM